MNREFPKCIINIQATICSILCRHEGSIKQHLMYVQCIFLDKNVRRFFQKYYECAARVRSQSAQPECAARVRSQSAQPECAARVRSQSAQPECAARVRSQSAQPECAARVRSQSAQPECAARITFHVSISY